MTLVRIMLLTTDLPPVAVIRKERISISRRIINLRQTQTVGQRQGLLIDTGTTDDIDVLVGSAMRQGFF